MVTKVTVNYEALARAYILECPATPLSHIQASAEYLANYERPYQVSAYVTRACNLSCIHCYISAGRSLENELTADEWSQAFVQLRKLGTEQLYILGGEPMMRPDIYQIISSASEAGLRVSMSTNGTLITRRSASMLKESGLNEAQVSIDAPIRELNDSIRVPGSFERALSAVRYLKEVGLRVTIGVVLLNLNADLVEDMVRLAKELGADGITFEAVAPFGRAASNRLRLDPGRAWDVIKTVSKYGSFVSLSSMRFYIPNLLGAYEAAKKALGPLASKYRTCPAGRSRLVIDSNGDVYGCELFIGLRAPEGNLRRTPLREIWERGFSLLRLRRPSGACSTCPMFDMCWGGCPARSLALTGSINNPDPLCPLASKAPVKDQGRDGSVNIITRQ